MPASSRASRARDAREIDLLNRKVAELESQLASARGPDGASSTSSADEHQSQVLGLAPAETSPDGSQSEAVLVDTIGSLAIAGEDRTVSLQSCAPVN